ncbi:MAG: tRNA (adenosine(37)-N6)-threonylcarbamoyltransferase complex ATPase subunit type 1 TsaE [Candidatus Cloacimonetes bacterium]|nr:tRNA (adenosine(37)-N6)-threonylcarbamoyltransferase complex ATPase subunit type 1 TsaE [Candidatus Cloacimonadota bacterium]
MQYLKQSKRDVSNLAKQIANTLMVGDILLLHGELGAGKTYFCGKLCRWLGVRQKVNSPSYLILNEYEGKYKIFHYDFYRLNSSEDALEVGILDRLEEGVTIIEWPNLVEKYLPPKGLEIYFQHNGNFRDITLKKIH